MELLAISWMRINQVKMKDLCGIPESESNKIIIRMEIDILAFGAHPDDVELSAAGT